MVLKRGAIVFFMALSLLVSGCEGPDTSQDMQRKHVFAMDTTMTLTAYGDGAEEALDAAEKRIYQLEEQLSPTKHNSEVSRVNRSEGAACSISREVREQMQTALEVSRRTEGAFDISVYPITRAWGFDSQDKRVPEQAEIDELLPLVNYRNIKLDGDQVTLEPGMKIDLSALAKGYASDQLVGMLKEQSVTSAILSLGGNVHTLGNKPDGTPWRIALQDPAQRDSYLGMLEVTDKAVVTSGGYQRYFEQDGVRYHHILDPKTGYPVNNGLASVTVVSESGAEADALSTALYVLGLERAADYWRTYGGFEAIFITDDRHIYATEGLQDCFAAGSGSFELIRRLP